MAAQCKDRGVVLWKGKWLKSAASAWFREVEGIDLSASLAAEYSGLGKILVGDCRQLPFEDASKDVLIVQGGLYHLPVLPDDLDQVLADATRVLKDDGLLLVIEPWPTIFFP
jgi:ubiquinone/menaquinone biosynthesis C-methylase UbiE